jgi:hypothetical protein
MAVPDTSTFDLQTVVNVVNPTTDDLIDSFADAVASKFDSTYSGSKNELLNFRNYDSTVVNTLIVSWDRTGAINSHPFAHITNQSVDDQDVTFTWKYVSYSTGDNLPPTVRLGSSTGTNVSTGYTTSSITENLSADERNGQFYPEEVFYVYFYGGDDYATFEFTLTSAETDTVPSSPDNKVDVEIIFDQ